VGPAVSTGLQTAHRGGDRHEITAILSPHAMNRFLFVAALAIALAAAAPKVSPPAVGAQAPDFTLLDQNSKQMSLAKARGHKAVIVFYRGYW
jgi:cytochrome oxidase Cu insertion factor (SCO1/SenC/PrrC family)